MGKRYVAFLNLSKTKTFVLIFFRHTFDFFLKLNVCFFPLNNLFKNMPFLFYQRVGGGTYTIPSPPPNLTKDLKLFRVTPPAIWCPSLSCHIHQL